MSRGNFPGECLLYGFTRYAREWPLMCTIEPNPPLECTKIVGIAPSHRHPFLFLLLAGPPPICSTAASPWRELQVVTHVCFLAPPDWQLVVSAALPGSGDSF